VPGVLGIGPAGNLAWNPNTKTMCISVLGLGAAAGHNVAIGPIMYSSGNVDSILSGWSISAGGNLPDTMKTGNLGVQIIGNSSGIAYGTTTGVPGLSGAVTYSLCGKLW
jgi:hypothetical protein